ncbi:MAG: hypothetical protein KH452_12370 [Clostridiales bacterium]|nr:hypothetical protein [Clostridiales bacterium]
MKKKLLLLGCSISFGLTACTGKTEPPAEPELISMTVYSQGICQNWLPESIAESGLFHDIQTLRWMVPRGGIGIEEPSTVQNTSENAILSESSKILKEYDSQMKENWYFDFEDDNIWIRLNYHPYTPPEGVNDLAHDDLMLYVEGEDLHFAIQDTEDENVWEIKKIPEYGSWMEKELEMLYRLHMGL